MRQALPFALAAPFALSGCLYATGGVETFEYPIAPMTVASIEPASAEPPLSPTELQYARDTARVVFRRRGAERTESFVPSAAGAYGLCLRSNGEPVLLVFERRVFDEAISQAADDARILRGRADTAVCRERARRWVAL